MPGLLGKKLGMTNIYAADGTFVPVTVIEVGPCPVVRIKTVEKDGYEAVQLGFEAKKEKNVNKPDMGQFKKAGLSPLRHLKEFKGYNVTEYKVGDNITIDLFAEGEKVKVSAKSKGKGFQGVMRRHNFGGVGTQTHGQHNRLRHPGSIGSSSYPSRVFKGMRMAGRMGYENFTIRNLKVVKIVPEKNIMMVKGSIPGAINTIVEIIK